MRCDKCGTENKENAQFCEECGKQLNDARKTSIGGYIDTFKKNRNLMLVSLIVLVLIVASAGYMGLNPTSSTLSLNNSSKINNSSSNQVNQNNNPQVKGQRTVCSVCGGSGSLGICSTCGGTGFITCPDCGGHGLPGSDICPTCGDSGKIKCPGGQGPCNNGKRVCGACGGDGYMDSGDPGPMK